MTLATNNLLSREEFSSTALPDKQSESWRNLELKDFRLDDFDWDGSKLETKIECNKDSIRTYKSINDLEISQKQTIAKLGAEFEEDYFDRLNRVYQSNVNIIVVEKSAPRDLILDHRLESGNAAICQTIILVQPSVQIRIVENFIADKQNSASSLWVPALHIICAQNSTAEYTAIMDLGERDWNFARSNFSLQADSNLSSAVVLGGAHKTKLLSRTQVHGRGATYEGIGVRAGKAREICDVEMIVSHKASDSQSTLLYKTVLNDHSRSMFTGNLDIASGLKNVSSHQTNHNILLTKTARAQSMPHLVIKAEEVTCEHGATVGALDEEALFYLMARGFSRADAKHILIEAFLNTLIAKISGDEHRSKISKLLFDGLSLQQMIEADH